MQDKIRLLEVLEELDLHHLSGLPACASWRGLFFNPFQLASALQAEPVPADAPELSKEEAKLLEELPDAPKTRIPPETVKQPSKEGPPIAQRRAASQEAPLAA